MGWGPGKLRPFCHDLCYLRHATFSLKQRLAGPNGTLEEEELVDALSEDELLDEQSEEDLGEAVHDVALELVEPLRPRGWTEMELNRDYLVCPRLAAHQRI